MSFVIVGGILAVIFVISMVREPRSFGNALLLLLIIGFLLITLAATSSIGGKIVGALLLLIPLAFVAAAVFLVVNGFKMMKKEGRQLQNILSLLTGIAMIAGGILTITGAYYFQDAPVAETLFYLVLMLEFYIAFTFAALLIYSIIYTCLPKRINCDYIIVHGCGLTDGERVSPMLKARVDKALCIYRKCEHSAPKIVVSGGKGDDEKISEAAAMRNYLAASGFPEENIISEDKSRSTFENLKNVRDMLDVNGVKHRYIFVTNNYHVFRTGLFAKKLKMKASGVGCRTAAYYWPSAFIREYIAIMWKYKWMFAVIVLLWCLIIAMVKFQ